MASEKLIYASEARKAILKADPKLTYCIDNIKGVDAVEVVHGRWIKHPNYFQGHYESTDYECSECGLTRDSLGGANYCPSCGAKMDGDGNV